MSRLRELVANMQPTLDEWDNVLEITSEENDALELVHWDNEWGDTLAEALAHPEMQAGHAYLGRVRLEEAGDFQGHPMVKVRFTETGIWTLIMMEPASIATLMVHW